MKNNLLKILICFLIIFITPIYILITPVYAFSPSSSTLYEGIDVSGWQGNINYEQVKNAGIEIVYMKSSEGNNFVDPYFNQNYANAKANGLKVGFYHYLTARNVQEAVEQATFFLSVISGKNSDCRLAMDFESFGNLTITEINQIGLAFVRTVETLSKKEVVIAKYIAVVLLQITAFTICAVCTVVRMTFLSDVGIYTTNALMGANLVFLAFVLLIFAVFNVIFVGEFFKTAYGIGKQFVTFIIVNFLIIGLAETLHHLPGLDWLNTLDFSCFGEHFLILVVAVIVYVAFTVASCRVSQSRFEKIDL